LIFHSDEPESDEEWSEEEKDSSDSEEEKEKEMKTGETNTNVDGIKSSGQENAKQKGKIYIDNMEEIKTDVKTRKALDKSFQLEQEKKKEKKEEKIDGNKIEIKDEDNKGKEKQNETETKTKEEEQIQNTGKEDTKAVRENQNNGNIKETKDENSLKYILIISCIAVIGSALLFKRKFI
jgi:hypothetical protein